eukprot:6253864-Alexandrium_andersonii.AAC.1
MGRRLVRGWIRFAVESPQLGRTQSLARGVIRWKRSSAVIGGAFGWRLRHPGSKASGPQGPTQPRRGLPVAPRWGRGAPGCRQGDVPRT